MVKHNLEKITVANKNYRKVIETTSTMQLVLMSLDPGVEIGMESHHGTTQFFRVESGTARAEVGKKKFTLKDGDSLIVPPSTRHNVWCPKTSKKPCKLYTIYSPPQHAPGTIHKTKETEGPSERSETEGPSDHDERSEHSERSEQGVRESSVRSIRPDGSRRVFVIPDRLKSPPRS